MRERYRYVTWVANTLGFMFMLGATVLTGYVWAFYVRDNVDWHPLLHFLLLLLCVILISSVSCALFWAGEAIQDFLTRRPGGWLPRRTIDFKR